jgi:hypothetical protein
MFDINLNQSVSKLCNGQSRRDYLRVGTLGASRPHHGPHLLQQQSLNADEAPQRRAKSVILVYLGGGPVTS